jgi:hypothetical protein
MRRSMACLASESNDSFSVDVYACDLRRFCAAFGVTDLFTRGARLLNVLFLHANVA